MIRWAPKTFDEHFGKSLDHTLATTVTGLQASPLLASPSQVLRKPAHKTRPYATQLHCSPPGTAFENAPREHITTHTTGNVALPGCLNTQI